MPIAFRDPGFRFFEPSETSECATCRNTCPDDTMSETTTHEMLCYTCATAWEHAA